MSAHYLGRSSAASVITRSCLLGEKPGTVPEFLSAVNLLMQCESRRQSCLKIDLFSGDGVLEIEKLGMQEISSVAWEAGEILKRLAG